MNDDLKRWDEEVEEWSRITQNKRTLAPELLKKELPEILGDIHNRSVLDAGCGDGYFAQVLTELSATVTAVDGSPNMIAQAKKLHPELNFGVADLTQPLEFPSDTFDFVICLFVVMSIADIEILISESFRVLKNGGRLVICTFHPAFNFPTLKLHRNFFAKLNKGKVMGIVRDYFQKTTTRQDDEAGKPWPYYHRTISEYTRTFINAGFRIRGIHEPHKLSQEYLKLHPKHEYATRLPRFMIFDLQK